MCQIRFDSASWPGARQPSGSSTSEAYGPVSFFLLHRFFFFSAVGVSCNRHATRWSTPTRQRKPVHRSLSSQDLNKKINFEKFFASAHGPPDGA